MSVLWSSQMYEDSRNWKGGLLDQETRNHQQMKGFVRGGMVGYSGFEPLTSSMSRKRSNQLS